ncbi:MAG: hypothetical protein AMXMBFR64_03280 [Myxococcales bacterium]
MKLHSRSALALLALLAACEGAETTTPDSAGSGTDTASADPSLTWSGGVQHLFAESCVGCHTAGGIAPFALDDFETAHAYADAALAAVEAGRMPPWMPDPACREYVDQRVLTADQVATLRGWVEAGAPKGDGAQGVSHGAHTESSLGDPSLRIGLAAAYTPNAERPDDYRCFILDHTFEKETYMVASQVLPDQRALVHHVLLYLLPSEMVAAADALDAADEGPGYTCFGGPGVSSKTIGAWVPGAVPVTTPADTAIRLPAGSRIVMQIHYNLLSTDTLPDQTALDLWLTEEQPKWLLSINPQPHFSIDIAAGDPESVQTRDFPNKGSKPWTVVGVLPHMHMLGKRISVTALHGDGTEECMVDIPRWDFNWQQGYRFLTGQEVIVAPGDSVRLECVYDNSAANQPVVNGVKQTPANVTWGEGTLDEMCLNYVMVVEPYEPLPPIPPDVCAGFDGCYADCRADGGLTACILGCGSKAASGCTKCIVQGLLGCTAGDCGGPTADLVSCLSGCQGSADFQGCVYGSCADSITAFDACADPVVAAGTCDAPLSSCDVTLDH